MTFYAIHVSFLSDVCESRDSVVLRKAFLSIPSQEEIDSTVNQWVIDVANACDNKKLLYKVSKILSVKIIDFIVEVEDAV